MEAGVLLSFDPVLTANKQTQGLRGEYGVQDGFSVLLAGSGLSLVRQADGSYSLQAITGAAAAQLPAVKISSSYEPLNAGVSGNRRVVSQEDIDRIQANDLEDVFRKTPSVAVGGSVGIAEKVYVRGLEDALLNVTIDGATQAGVLFHHAGRLSIEPELLKQVEVHAGAGVATDGPGALGGAIRFTTKDPEDLLRPGERFGALIKGGYFDNTEGYKASVNLFGRFNDNWSGMATVAKSDSDAITDGNGTELGGTESEQTMGFAKVVGKLTDSQTVRVSYDLREDDGIRAQRPQWVISDWNPGYPLKIERETVNLGYQLNPADNPFLNLEVTVYDTQAELEQNVIGRWGVYNGSSESQGVNLRNTTQLSSHELIYGAEYRDDTVNAGPGTDPSEQEENGSVTGFFVQDLYQVTDKLLLSAGVRYDDYELTDTDNQEFEADGFSPNVGVSYQLTPTFSVNASYAEALRGRQTMETFLLDSRMNDPELEAEESENTEVGFEYYRDAFGFSGTFYRAQIDNAINDQRIPVNGIPRWVFRNIGDIETEGFDLRVSYDWTQVQVGLSYSDFDSELAGDNGDLELNAYDHGALGNTIGNTWTADVAYQVNDALELGWNGRLVESLENIRTSAGTVDKSGYAVHDIYAQWFVTPDFNVTFTVKNLFDKYYIDHATNGSFEHIPGYEGIIGLSEPGRDLRLTLSWRI
ncbi:hypothetical protein CBR65_06880 [Cellvibrio sp. PSBB006]|nr:hypothetical protein CBR65_06880 [Cellvibrio sp. PSBB006]